MLISSQGLGLLEPIGRANMVHTNPEHVTQAVLADSTPLFNPLFEVCRDFFTW